jgi:Protein of unknown function (DUF3159)
MADTRDSAAAMTSESPPSLADAVGGPLGVAESALPAAAFVVTYTVSGQDTTAALIAAIGLGVIFAVARIVRGQTVQFALAGLGGLALSAYVVSRTGKAEDFFLPGLLANAAYATAYLVSILVRWPLLGVILSALRGGDMSWREDPEAVRSYSRASWIWVALFSLRLAVQLPLYLASALTALGVARIAMGIPLFAVGIWLSWLILRPRRQAPIGPSSGSSP